MGLRSPARKRVVGRRERPNVRLLCPHCQREAPDICLKRGVSHGFDRIGVTCSFDTRFNDASWTSAVMAALFTTRWWGSMALADTQAGG
jgi:hypothetical protein